MNENQARNSVTGSLAQETLLRARQCLNLKASELRHLFDVFTYEDRRGLNERDQAIQARQLALRKEFQEYRRQIHSVKESLHPPP